jgi:Zn-dependent peptidase ImmA (M78 family)/transcriptional regulator with XRE-family HTH domain
MSISVNIKIKPGIFKWLRESSGWTITDVSNHLEIPEDTVLEWEDGNKYPTFNEISKLAKAFKRPSAAFFLARPEYEPPMPQDFRRLPNTSASFTKKTIEAFRRARNLQSASKELMDNLDLEVKSDVITASLRDSPENIAISVRELLGISIEEQTGCKDKYRAFKMWRNCVENVGIHVFQFPMELSELRGFTIIDSHPYAIVLNSSDDIQARIFTLFHEYGHILLHESALCTPETPTIDRRGAEIEGWCNRFAAASLLPADEVSKEYHRFGLEQYARIANKYKVSQYATLTRLVSLKLISDRQYTDEVYKLKAKLYKKPEGRVCETAAVRARREMGEGFISLVIENSQKGLITYSKALDYLDVKTKGLQELMKQTQ